MTGDTQAPERLGPYRLLRKIGEGGMGAVHLGLDEDGREVAVKVLHPHVAADLKARDRLTREVETMRRVRSPHVAEVLDARLTGAQPYIVTRFAPGRTLEETVLADGPLPDEQVIRLARGLCAALVAIHAADVVHRDLKPANVMLVDGDPLVIDFGIAHLVNATRLTQTGMFVGTPGYLAPEIIRDSEITQAADVHALASTVFFAATGKPPFGTGSFEVVCFNIMEGRANLDLAPAWLRGWLRRALDVDAAARPGAQELYRAARSLDPAVTAFRSEPHTGSHAEPPPRTAVLGGGTRVLPGEAPPPDGTRIIDPVPPDGTEVIGRMPSDGTRVLDPVPPDGTKIIDPVPSAPANGARALAQDETFSDLLPPVEYAKPDRRDRKARDPRDPRDDRGRSAAAAPPPYVPAAPPPPYVPAPPAARRAAPPPYPDQRVAGYPAPQPTGPAQPYPPPATQPRGYTPPAPPRHTPPAPERQARPPYRTGHPLAALLLLVIAVGLACVLPVAVSAIALVAVLCLRVGENLFGDLAERRSVRGSSASDPLLVLVGTPWALLKAATATLLTGPLAAMFGMCVWGALVYIGKMGTDQAAAYAAGAFVAGLFVLPGGGKPRKAVSRALTGVIRSPGAAMVTTIILGTLAFFTVMAALGMNPSFDPWRPPSVAVRELTESWKAQANESAMGVMDLIGGLVDDLLKSVGLGFLSFWK
ncbi:serine/threonine protein kinase [Planomonospora sphaerica]|uniref:Serine/threonine protein kinase n=1 Tax=Planomonospora sphaerica TaxID=161355 RepID=A0A161LNT4_9ACTN|nr:serine/threonine-protein kinase [Planomonospora sphaerica]GAT67616.1 serine/threonine protein kinase [Planomonospora sphaerica]